MSNPCMVLDVTEHDQWAPFRGCHRIPEDCRPTVLHPSKEVAEQEALRLASAHPLAHVCHPGSGDRNPDGEGAYACHAGRSGVR